MINSNFDYEFWKNDYIVRFDLGKESQEILKGFISADKQKAKEFIKDKYQRNVLKKDIIDTYSKRYDVIKINDILKELDFEEVTQVEIEEYELLAKKKIVTINDIKKSIYIVNTSYDDSLYNAVTDLKYIDSYLFRTTEENRELIKKFLDKPLKKDEINKIFKIMLNEMEFDSEYSKFKLIAFKYVDLSLIYNQEQLNIQSENEKEGEEFE